MNQKEWTIMVYMAGDNNLSVDMAYAMEQIKNVAGNDGGKFNLFVYYDGYSESIPTLYCDFSDMNMPRHIRSYKVKDKLYQTPELHDENAADAYSVLNFVDWCVNKVRCEEYGEVVHGRKAEKYALIFSGHSMGFQDIGLFKDESSDVSMGMHEMNALLERITMSEEQLIEAAREEDPEIVLNSRDTGEIIGRKLDILGFDSCVMSMLEVGYQFHTVAKTMIASEGSVPSAGWTYAKLLGNLANESDSTPLNDIVAKFVAGFVRSQDSYTIGGVSVDMSAWDLANLKLLNDDLEELTARLLECFDEVGSTIYRQMERVLLQVHWKCQSYMYEQNVDLGDFCELLKGECISLIKELGEEHAPILSQIADSCDGLTAQLKNSVILSGFSGGKYQYSNGISLFFPWSLAAYEVSLENYESLRFVRETGAGNGWNTFLNKYLNEISLRRAPGATDREYEESSAAASSGLNLDLRPIPLEMKGADLGVPGDIPKVRYYSYQYEDTMSEASLTDDGVSYESDLKLGGQSGTKLGGQSGTKLGGQSGTKLGGQSGTKLGGQSGTKLGGQSGTKLGGQSGTKLGGQSGTKLGGQSGTKLGGQSGTKLGGQSGTKLGGQSGTKLGGQSGTKLGGQSGTKLGGQSGTKLGGQSGTKLGGQSGTKLGGQSGTKLGGQSGTKLGGQSGTKLGGQSGTKLGGQSGTKLGGQSGTKLAGGGSSAFFDSFKHFKNIETPWNISGFTKDPKVLLEGDQSNSDDDLSNSTAGGSGGA